MDSDRDAAIERLLAETGFGSAARERLPGDASTRRYERLRLGERAAMLMDAPPSAESAPCPPSASPEERTALGYNAQARLAAGRVEAFVAVAARLRKVGLSAPEVYGADLASGLAIVEDFGDDLMWRLIEEEGRPPAPFYEAAIDALALLQAHPAPALLEAGEARWPLLAYDRTALFAEADLLLEWFAGRKLGRVVDDAARADWIAAWDKAFAPLDQSRRALVLRDLHAQNVIWLPGRDGAARAGLLDFQDALAGHPAYDLVSLLEDARRDVEPDLADAMIQRYLARAGVVDAEAFLAAYATLGAQRNAKILGIFCRLALRDGKERYLALLPRVARYFLSDLRHPALAPVRDWIEAHLPSSGWGEAAISLGAAA